MEYPWFFLVLSSVLVHFFVNQVLCNICIRQACNDEKSLIVCNNSLILISDVTDWRLERDHRAFENMKRACMGKGSCDPSRVCSHEDKKTLVVHYFCVDASHIRSKRCSRHVKMIDGDAGYIQSPGYPAATSKYIPCRWRIEPPNGSVVVLSLHDIAISGTTDSCDGGLVVSGRSCDGEGHAFAPRLLCGGDNLNSLMRCGKVDIELSPSDRVYPLRFWLSYYVHSRDQPSNFQASLLPCSGWIYSMDTGGSRGGQGVDFIETTPFPAMSSTETNTELLIIMLSIISGISAVLLIILIVVCVRCRLLRASHAEPVYSDPSPGLQAHYEYISSLESEKPRPQLADGYFEVADALPINQRGETPTSPAYAEVEQFATLRKGPWSSMSDENLRGSKYLTGDAGQDENGQKSHGDHPSDNPKVASNDHVRPKRGVLGRLKHKSGDKALKNDHRNSTGPKIIVTSPKKASSSSNAILSGDTPQTDDDDNSSAAYEQIGEFTPIKALKSEKRDKRPPIPSNHPPTSRVVKMPANNQAEVGDISTQNLTKVSDCAKAYTEKWIKSQQSLQNSPDKLTNATSTIGRNRKAPDIGVHTSCDAERSKTLPSKNTKRYLQNPGMKNNNYKPATYKDVPRTRGIVKNGIQKFEQNRSSS